MATKEFFPGIGKIPFEGTDSKNPMAFHYYEPERVVCGRKMEDWFKFSLAWWHSLCAEGSDQFGGLGIGADILVLQSPSAAGTTEIISIKISLILINIS